MGTDQPKKGFQAPKVSTQQFIMALLVMALVVCIVFILAFQEIPKDNKDMFNFVLGNITGILGTMAMYMWPSKKQQGGEE